MLHTFKMGLMNQMRQWRWDYLTNANQQKLWGVIMTFHHSDINYFKHWKEQPWGQITQLRSSCPDFSLTVFLGEDSRMEWEGESPLAVNLRKSVEEVTWQNHDLFMEFHMVLCIPETYENFASQKPSSSRHESLFTRQGRRETHSDLVLEDQRE